MFWPINSIRVNVETGRVEQRTDLKANSPFLLLGVGTAFFPYSGDIIGAPLGTFYKENSGLGIVYRAQVIKNLITDYLSKKDQEVS